MTFVVTIKITVQKIIKRLGVSFVCSSTWWNAKFYPGYFLFYVNYFLKRTKFKNTVP